MSTPMPDPRGLRRIAVFRALVLGDMLCAVPALRAMRRAWPAAEVTLVGLPWAQAWAERCPHVDRFVAFPGLPGLPERAPDVGAMPGFLAAMQAHRFDLAIQLHGSGTLTNPLVALFGARHTAGFVDGGGCRPTYARDWPRAGHEIERLLAMSDRLGAPRQGLALEFPLRPEDDLALAAQWPGVREARDIACVHVGAQLPSRRWWPERFAAVADRLAAQGATVVFTGTDAERPLVTGAGAAMRHRAVDLAGRTTLWSLGALVRRARVLVCNDTGVSHVAAALGTPSVVVSLGADARRWAPLDHDRHRVLWADVPCRPCAHRDCPVGHTCAAAIQPHHVDAAAADAARPTCQDLAA